MNDENLIPNSKRSPSEVRENGKKGGVESGKSRSRKKALRTVLKEFLGVRICDISDKGARDLLLKAAGCKDTEKTVGELVITGMVQSSIRGNSQMMKLMFELIGEDPAIEIKRKELKLKKEVAKKAAGVQDEDGATIIELPAKEYEDLS